MEDNYTKAYKEVMEILKFEPQDSVNKIPKIMIEVFSEIIGQHHIKRKELWQKKNKIDKKLIGIQSKMFIYTKSVQT